MENKTKFLLGILGLILIGLVVGGIYFRGKNQSQELNPEEKGLKHYLIGGNTDIGFEELDNGNVWHIWNLNDDYYFNASSGIQFTNHYDEYWTHNIFCAGYKTTRWNYDCNDALPFNWSIETDNLTYVNITGWRNKVIGNKMVRIALRYHLKLNDLNLTIIPYIKNIGGEDITQDIGFAWRVNNIKIGGDEDDDLIKINNTVYQLFNLSENLSFINLEEGSYKMFDETEGKFLTLDWNKNLNYKVNIENISGQYNAPTTLMINAGSLNVGQEKSTEFYWIDANQNLILRPDNDGHENDWTPTSGSDNYAMVDEVVTNDSDYVLVTSGNQEDYWELENTGANGAISYVEIWIRTMHTNGNEEFQICIADEGGTEECTSDKLDYTTFTDDFWNLSTNPITSTSWTFSHINNLEIGVKSRSIGGFNGEARTSQAWAVINYAPNANINVSISEPTDNQAVTQNTTFNVVASVTCNDNDCGWVNGVARYNDSGSTPDTFMNITEGATPFHSQSIGSFYVNGTGQLDLSGKGLSDNHGISFNGTHFAGTESTGAEVYIFDTTGANTSHFDLSEEVGGNVRGITNNGTHWLVATQVDKEVFFYNFDGTYAGVSFDTSGSGNENPGSMAFNGSSIFVGDLADDFIYEYSSTGSSLGFHDVSSFCDNIRGINSNGTHFFVYCQEDEYIYLLNSSFEIIEGGFGVSQFPNKMDGLTSDFMSGITLQFWGLASDVELYNFVLTNGLSCGNMLQDETCQLNWTINGTGLGLYEVDVIFNGANNSNVEDKETGDRTVNLTIVGAEPSDNPPIVTLSTPTDETSSSDTSYLFKCNVTDDQQIDNTTLYVWNTTGVFNTTLNTSTGTSLNYTFNVSDFIIESYEWNCLSFDNNSASSWADDNFTLTVTSEDTCNPTSPLTEDYTFECSDNCNQTSVLDAGGNKITLHGSGSFNIRANIINFFRMIKDNNCRVNKLDGIVSTNTQS